MARGDRVLGRWMGWRSGQIEAAKWLGFALMVVDHVGQYVLHEPGGVLNVIGRAAFPLFALSFAAGWMARGGDVDDAGAGRLRGLAWRCGLWGGVAMWPWSVVTGGVGLNMLFVFPLAVLLYRWFIRDGVWFWLGSALFVLSGLALVGGSYGWAGLVMVMACLRYQATARCFWLLLAVLAWLSSMKVWMWAPAGVLLLVVVGVLSQVPASWRWRLPKGSMAALYAGQWFVMLGLVWFIK